MQRLAKVIQAVEGQSQASQPQLGDRPLGRGQRISRSSGDQGQDRRLWSTDFIDEADISTAEGECGFSSMSSNGFLGPRP